MSRPMPTPIKRSKPSSTRWTPHAYQKKAIKFLLQNFSAGLFLDPGLGKTSVTLAAAKVLRKEKTLLGLLVVAPLRPARSTWPNEVNKWGDFKDTDIVVLHGKDFSRLCREKHDVYAINYEGLQKLFWRKKVGKTWTHGLTEDGKALLKHVNGLVWDELSRMKHTDTQRFKLVKPHLKKFLIKWGLTGSPASNGLEDLFGQCYALDEGRTLGSYITHYRTQYFTALDTLGRNRVLNPGADKLIYERLKPLVLRMDADDYLKLPRHLDHVIKFDLPDKVRPQYDAMEDEMLTVLESLDIVTAANQAGASSKCRQICSGAVYLPDIDPVTGEARKKLRSASVWSPLHDEKLDLLSDLIDELQGQQLLVGYEFRHDLERLLKRFPNTPFIGGGVSGARGQEIEDAWNAGEIPLLFGHPASMGHGLNFQESNAHHICWFTMTWDFELYDQFIKRLRRQGNKADTLHNYHLIAKDTVEERVYGVLRAKNRTQKKLLDALKS